MNFLNNKLFVFVGVITFMVGCEYSNVETKFPVCDTNAVSYNNHIKPILQTNCYSCHGTNTNDNSGGIILEDYNTLKVFASNGYLYGNVAHLPFPYHAMPPRGNKLSNCDINKIKAWVDNGSPEN